MTASRRTLDRTVSEAALQKAVLEMADLASGTVGPAALKDVSEKEFMEQVVKAARWLGCLVFHTYDSRRCSPGFPDLVIVRGRIVFAELKTEIGRVTPEQQTWIQSLRRAGVECHVWRPSDMDRIIEILSGM